MRSSDQQFSRSFTIVLGVLIGVAVGPVALAASEEPSATHATRLTGQQVYNNVCIACHSPPGVGGAPALGDADAWAPRIAQGMGTLIEHALTGFTGSTGVMPKKGERLDLSDEEIIGAVEYMVGQVEQ
jgi:S-disulfanyl-L-cysteine oxidoreductase SoxD